MRTLIAVAALTVFASAASAQREPKLGLEDASKKAREAAGGGRVERAELEEGQDKLLWSFDVRLATDAVTQVWLDADTGKVVKLDAEQGAQREAYAQTARKQLDDLQKRIDEMKKEASGRSAEARKVIEERAAALEVKRKEAEKELAELETTGRSRWHRFQSALDRALIELRKGYDEAVSTGTVVTSPPDSPAPKKR
jgi:Skp family chaperone for outer membrane proteins